VNTFRSHSLRYASRDPLLYGALQVALAGKVDYPLSAWEEAFLPEMLAHHLRSLEVMDEDGRKLPFVISEELRHASAGDGIPAQPPAWWVWYGLTGLLAGTLFLALGMTARRSLAAQLGLSVFGGAWILSVGVLGGVLAWMWAFTGQVLAHANENLFQLNPVALVVGWLMLTGALGAERERWFLTRAVWIFLALSVAGTAWKLLPGANQANGAVIAAALPAWIGLGVGLWAWERGMGCADPRTRTVRAEPAPDSDVKTVRTAS
jgi:hypothetical protein